MLQQFAPIELYENQNIDDLEIEDPDWSFLNRLKRQPDQSIFYYWHQTIQLITTEKAL